MIPEERLRELEALAEDASPGPWSSNASLFGTPFPTGVSEPEVWDAQDRSVTHPFGFLSEEDVRFIAAARQAVPELVQEVRALREAVQTYFRTQAEVMEATAQHTAAVALWRARGHDLQRAYDAHRAARAARKAHAAARRRLAELLDPPNLTSPADVARTGEG